MTDITVGAQPVTIITVETVLLEHRSSHQQPAPLRRRQWELQMTKSLDTKPLNTKSFFASLRDASLALGLAAIVSLVATSSSFAFSAEAQQQCTGDAFRLCSSEIPNIPKITACMMKHRSDLSAGCRAVMDKDLAKGASRKVADAQDKQ
ncbi:hypothetical protein SAMN05216573_115166 [Bradyrhizobium sp. Rc3b]|nr:hypothetical protein SAMN05216573_115166 [Bradyrhizobium sp. Rc3b]